MWPWGHLAVGYLLYTALARRYFDRPPGDAAALAAGLGTQFPDLVDKPLAWTIRLLPSGRSLAHSGLTAFVVCGLVGWYARRHGRPRVALAFAVGYASHLAADGVVPLLAGEYRYVAYLGWPVVSLPPYDTSVGFLEHLASLELSPFMLTGLALTALAVGVWLRDGRPGSAVLRGWLPGRTTEH